MMTPRPTPAQIDALIDADRLDEALDATRSLPDSGSDPDLPQLLFLRGKTLWRLGLRSEAIGAYSRSAALAPGGPATRGLELATEIDSFYNPDIFNP